MLFRMVNQRFANALKCVMGSVLLAMLLSVPAGVSAQSVVVNKFYNSGSSADIVELLVIEDNADLRGLIVKDFSSSNSGDGGGQYTFTSNALWASVPAGTLIILRGASTAAADVSTGCSDYVLDVGLANTTYFTKTGGTFDIATSDMIMVKTGTTSGNANNISTLKAGTSGSLWTSLSGGVKISTTSTAGSSTYAYASNNGAVLTDFNLGTSGVLTTTTAKTFGAGNTTGNTNFINFLRGPVSAAASSITATGFTANWSTLTGVTVTYRLDVATDVNFTSMVAGYNNLTVTGSSHAVTGLSSSTTYYYRVRAVNSEASPVTSGNSCTQSATTLVGCTTPTAYAVTGTGSYCAGGAGVAVGLANSQTNVNYQLYRGASAVGSVVAGSTGSAISFGLQTVAGTYTVHATTTTGGCTNDMTGSAVITINALPTVNVTPAAAASCNTITASGADTYTWAPATGLSATTGDAPVASPTVTTVYTVTGTDANGCENVATVTVTPASVAISGNSPLAGAAPQGTPNQLLQTYVLSVTDAAATISGLTVTTGGSYLSSDINTLKCWYSSSSVFDAGTATLLSSLSTPGTAGSKVFPAFTPQAISAGSTGYIYITAEIDGGAIGGNTINVAATNFSGFDICAATLTGTDPIAAAAVQTISASLCTGTPAGGASSPDTTFFCGTGTASLSITGGAVGSGLTYQWSSSATNTPPGTNIPGATSDTYTTPSLTTTTYYWCRTSCGINNSLSTVAVVSVNPVPQLDSASTGGAICAGGTLQLFSNAPVNVAAYAWEGPDSYTSTLQNPVIAGAGAAAAGVYTVTVNNGSGTGCAATYTTTATVLSAPSSTGATNSSPICDGGSVTLSANSSDATSWSWSGPGGYTSTLQNPVLSPTVTGTYSLSLSSGAASGCSPATVYTTTITVNAVPASTGPANSGPVCAGSSLTLTANSTNATSWSWSGPGGFTSTVENPVTTASTGGVYSLTVSSTGDGCTPADVYTTSVTVNDLPVVTATPPSGVSGVVFTASGATSYTWSPATGLSATTGSSVTASPGSAMTYTVTGTDASGCSASATVMVITPGGNVMWNFTALTANAASSSNANVTASACVASIGNSLGTVGSPIGTTSASSGYTGATGGGNIGNAARTGAFSSTLSAYVDYVITPNTGYCLSVSGISFGTRSTSTGPQGYTVTTDVAGLSGPVVATGSISNNSSWALKSNTFPAGIDGAPDMPVTVRVYGNSGTGSAGSGTINWRMDDVNFTYSVTPAPSLTSASNDGPVCAGGTLTLSAVSPVNVATYSWAGPSSFTSTVQNPVIAGITAASAGTYTVTVDNGYGCTRTYTTTVTVNTSPSSTGATNSGPVCSGSNVTLNANSSNADEWAWSGPSGFTSTVQNPVVTPAVAGVYSLTLTNTGTSCAAGTYTTEVTVNTLPTSAGATVDDVVCTGGSTTLRANSTGADSWSWTGPSFTSALENPGITPSSSATYSLTLANTTTGCTSSATYTVAVTVNPVPASSGPSNSGPVCAGSDVTLTANATNATAWTWSGPSGFTSTLQNPVVSPAVSGAYSLTVSSTGAGCSPSTIYTTSVVVNPIPVVSVSPSSGVSGDVFTASGADTYTWSPSSGLSATTGSAVTASPAANTVYTITGTSSGCSGTATLNVIVATGTAMWNFTALNGTASSSSNANVPVAGCVATIGNSLGTVAAPFSTTSASSGYTGATGSGNIGNAARTGALNTSTSAYMNFILTPNTGYCLTVYGLSFATRSTSTAPQAFTVTTDVDGFDGTAVATGAITNNSSWSLKTPAFSAVTGSPDAAVNVRIFGHNGTGSPGTGTINWRMDDVTMTYSVSPSPSLSGATNSGAICEGGTVTLSANAPVNVASYSWSGPSGFTSTLQNPVISGAAASASGTYTVTVNNGYGCQANYTTVVTVNALPSSSGVTTSGNICVGGSATLSANTSNADTWSWTGPDGFTSTVQNPVVSPTATATYTLTPGNSVTGCAAASTYTVAVIVNPVPASSGPSNTSPVCAGNNVTLSANSSNATAWSWSGPSGFTSTQQNPVITPSGSGTYSLTVSASGSGCSPGTVYTTTVTVNSLPASTGATNNGPLCTGANVTLSANSTGADQWSWTGPSSFTSTVQNPVFSPSSSGVYSLSLTNSATGCTSSSVYTTSVTVNSVPTAAPVNNGPVCAGGTVTLSAVSSDATSWSWTGPSGFSATVQNPTATPAASGIYSLMVSSVGTGCNPSTVYTTSVTVNSVPTAAPVNNGPICAGGTATLTATSSAATSWSWSGPSGFTSTVQNPVITPTVSGTYSLTVSASGDGCSPSTVYTTTVTVKSKPVAAPANNGYICNGGTVTLSANPSGGANTYTWSGSALASTTAQNPTATPTATTIYSLTVSDGTSDNGCAPADVYTTSVTVNTKPVAAPVNNGPICAGGTVTLTATPSGGANTYTWSGSALSSTTAQNPTATPTTTSVYSLTVSDGSSQPGCAPADVYTTSVTVRSKPTAAPTNNGYICNGGTVTLTANPANGATTYTWAGSSLASTTAENPTATPTATTVYSLTVSDGTSDNGCAPADVYTTSVTVNAKPVAAPANNGYICNGGTVTLSANPSGSANTYTWSGSALVSTTAQNPTATPTATTIYSLTVSDGSSQPGCVPSDVYTTSVTVNAKPVAAPVNNGPICAGGTVTLTATPSGGANTYTWAGSSLSSTTAQNPTATPTATSVYSLTVSDGSGQPGCAPADVYTTSVTVKSKPTAAPTNNGYICNGGTVTLTANPANGATTYTWAGSSLASTTTENPTATPTATTVYSLTVSDGTSDNGCAPAEVYTTSVTVNAKPVAAPSNNGYICNGGTVTLTATPSGGANTYTWAGSSLSSTTPQNPTATPTATSVYSLTVSDGSGQPGCAPADVYTTSVTVNAKPVAAPSNSSPICNGGTVTLTTNPSGGANTYTWSGSALSSTTVQNPTATPTANTVYSLTVSDGSSQPGCAPADIYTTSVTVNAKPEAAPVNNGPICVGGTATLTATPSGGATVYSWAGPDGFSSTLENPAVTPTATATYSLVVTNGTSGSGCTPSDVYTTTVTVRPTPVAAPVNNGYICVGGTVTLTATPSGGANTYAWAGSALSSTTAENPTATPTVTTVYTLTVSDGTSDNGCSPTTQYTTSVTVNAKPVASPVNNGYICAGGTVTLTATPSGGANTYTWAGSSLASTTAENPTATPVATSVYSLTVSDGSSQPGCAPTDVYTTTVTVNAKPTAAPTNNGYICNGGTVTLTANPANGAAAYTWAGASLASTTSENPTATPTATTVYSLTVSDGSSQPGCAPADIYTTSVTVNTKPVAAPVNNGPICAGGTVTLTATPSGGANTYTWAGASLASTTVENPTATPTTTSVYSLTVSDGSSQPGCAPSDVYTTSVTVRPKPIAAPTNNGYICEGGTATLTANPSGGATVYTWAGSSLSSTTAENPTANPTASATYSLTVSDGTTDNGCAPTDIYTTTVTVNAKPVAAPVNSGVLCNGGTVTLNAMPSGGANTYTWSGSSLVSTTAQNPTATPATGTHTYSLTVSDGSSQPGCAPADIYTTTVTVNPAPALTSATNDGPVCEGITLNFSANGATDVTGYSWSGPVALTGGTTATPSVPGSTTAATGTYSVAVNNGSGSGCVVTYTTSATVHLVPSVADITPSTTNLCIGADVTFTAGSTTGAGTLTSYNWSGPNGFSTTTGSGSTTLTATTTAQSGVYTLSVTYPGTGCTSPEVTSTAVTVNALPTMVSIGVSPATMCAGTVLTLTGNGAFGAGTLVSYNWSGPNGYSSTSSASAKLYTTPDANASGSYSVTVTYTGTGCTSNPVASSAVTVNALPTAYNITGGGFYCSGGTGVSIGLDGSDPGINYQLYNGSTAVGVALPGSGSPLDFGLQTASGTYSIQATNTTTSCTNGMTGTTDVSVGPVPVQYNVTGGGGYCAGGSGVSVGLSNADVSVSYQLYRDGSAIGSPVSPATAGAFSFGLYTTPGNYTVIANPSATCARTMNGSATISINPLPNQYTVSGGGGYCAGGAGVHIVQDFSVVGISYQLYRDGATVGAPVAGANSAADFGVYTITGTYSVLATNTTTGCTNAMNGMPVVSINPLPAAQTVTGGGHYCSGSTGRTVGLAATESGVNYQLYTGSTMTGTAVAGTGAAISFGTFTAAGSYSVRATNATTGCENGMSGSATITIDALPSVYAVNGGGTYCSGTSGVHVGLTNSDLGINYTLYNGGTAVSTVPGAAAGIDFGFQTAVGTYTVQAVDAATSCVSAMSGSATVSVNPSPVVHNVTGGGTICEGGGGLSVGLDGSNSGVSYQLYNGSTAVGSALAGTSLALDFGTQMTGGTYSVQATNTTTGCTSNMSGTATINVNPAPTGFGVTGGGGYCAGSGGVHVGLAASETGVQYQLYNGAALAGGVIAGTGSAIDFGVYTASGTYTVMATNISTLCTRAMTGSAVITQNPLPGAYTVTGGGTYCAGGSGVNVGLSGSAPGISYQLYNGSTAEGSVVTGSGISIDFGLKTAAGSYSVLATNSSTGCSAGMTGTATVAVSPAPLVYNVTGGGNYCSGGSGSVIGLDGSDVGISYRLYQGGVPVGSLVAGTGAAISLGSQTAVGSYSVVAINTGSLCTSNMTGTATVGLYPSPTVYAVSGGGHYCTGGSGVSIGLIGTESGTDYQLYRGATAVGGTVSGTGLSVDFGLHTVAGTYTVQAISVSNGCTAPMSGSAVVTIDPLPQARTVSGGGSYCSGGSGVAVGMVSSQSGVDYQLYNGATAMGSAVAGTGTSLSFGSQTMAGTYTVLGTDAVTGCENAMSGSATVVINPLPLVYNVTGGGSYCSDGSGVAVGLGNSQSGVIYQLYNGATAAGMPVAGTGSAISFGLQTAAGAYTVLATDATTSCVKNMNGSANVVVNPAPVVYNVTGGGTLCAGQPGYAVGLSGSEVNVIYELYNGSTSTGLTLNGTGSALSFGTFTTAGTYTVSAVNSGSGCTKDMSGGANIVVNPLPASYSVTGGGAFCTGGSGVSVGLSGSQSGISYGLYRGTTLAQTMTGTGAAISFGAQTVAGTYTILATNTTTACTRDMTGAAGVTVNVLPAVQTVTGGGQYCAGGAGVAIGLSGSQSGIAYQLYDGSTAYGSAAPGTGSAISFGNVDVAGTYSVQATSYSTGCTSAMSGTATVIMNPLPVAYSTGGGGNYCSGGSGVSITLSGSQSGTAYQLYNGSTAGATLSGTGAALSFGGVTATGTYTILATNTTTGCTRTMSGSASVGINNLPVAYTLTGGGTYCVGGDGVNIGMSSSQSGVNYQLYNGAAAVGSPFAGTGLTFDFGEQTATGTYSVLATDIFTGCSRAMNGTATIGTTPLPVVQTVTGGGSYCAGGAGVAVGLAATEAGISYQLYRDATVTGTPVAGTGAAISFGMQATAGTYTVQAINSSTGCTQAMSGSAVINMYALPAAYTVTGGGAYCAGGAGVAVGLSNSQSGTTYQLYYGSTATGSALAGTGGALSFGLKTAVGSYSVRATIAATGCSGGMTGTVAVTTNALPVVQTVSGGGSYCAGGAGVSVELGGSQSGVSYQLYHGATAVGSAVPGTGSMISFGLQTAAGSYSVAAVNSATGCSNNMSGAATITINALPVVQNVMGGGQYCAGGMGVHVTLGGSQTGISYQLYRNGAATGAAVAGTGSVLDFGSLTAAGTYSVSALNSATGCGSHMSGTAVISINTPPAVQNVTGGGSYCAGGNGVHVGLSSSESGVSYQLYAGSSMSGTAVAGTGAALDFGLKTAAGSYTVRATNSTTGCSSHMSGAAAISINPNPSVFTVSGGSSYCEGGTGVSIMLSGSNAGISYQLYNGATAVGTAVTGSGAAVNFGAQTAAGTYSVQAINTGTGCSSNMSGSATVNVQATPVVYAVTGGGAYCVGGNGVAVGLSNSQSGITYQLWQGGVASGSPVAGTGSAISFGLRSAVGTYSVSAMNSTTGCGSNMSGSATITTNPLPVVQVVAGGGQYCAGGTGVAVTMSGSQTGVDYQLYNGSTATGIAMAGTGGGLSFGLQTAAGTYTVRATVAGTGCSNNMGGSATISINPVPVVQSVTGGGAYCAGGNGVNISLSGSQSGVSYRLYVGSTVSGTAVAGTGSAISFGNRTAAGTYSVQATTAAGCTAAMSGTATISINNLPLVYEVTGGGNYCTGAAGVSIGLTGSQSGMSYQLYNGSMAAGAAMAGTGAELDFGIQSATGTYSVRATSTATGCTAAMTGTAEVNINALPVVQTVLGGGSYCAGGAGVTVTLSGSQLSTSYQLYEGINPSGTAVAGTGGPISFGNRTAAGTYTVKATNTLTGCASDMSGAAAVNINATPVIYNMTGGGSYCATEAGVAIGLSGSESGISYRLYNGAVPMGAAVSGTGGAISFGTMAAAGTYTVKATHTATGCTSAMGGTKTVQINSLPVVYAVSGGGQYCAGGSGVLVTLSGSEGGVNYELYNGSTLVSTAAGTGTGLNFGAQMAAGSYSVVARNATTGCVRNMSGAATVSINSLPVVQNVTGGGAYCAGGNGVAVTLGGSQSGISYRLYYGGSQSGAAVAGTGAAISFGNRTAAGAYTVKATNSLTGCTADMSGAATVSISSLPVVQTVNGGGSYCAGGNGVAITLGNTENNTTYTLYNGTATAATAAGTGAAVSFGLHTAAGSYSVTATSDVTGCTAVMSGAAVVTVDALPVVQSVTGGGAYCAGGNGMAVGLGGSQSGISYQLYNGSSAVGTAVAGTGSAISFGLQTAAGTYSVGATNMTTGCMSHMSGMATISINNLPAVYPVTGGGAYCAGDNGVAVGLGGSAAGISYVLRAGSATVATVSGTGAAISFGMITAAGTYNVQAVNAATGCSRSMTGTAVVQVNSLPVVQTMTGGGSYCTGENGLHVGLSGSQSDISYQLYRDGAATGTAVAGTGSGLDFGILSAAGSYSVRATNVTTGCVRDMSGAATISINALPVVQNITGGGSYCAGGTGVSVGLSASEAGVSYRLYRGAIAVGVAAGTGSGISFGSYTAAGTYTVNAVNTATGCKRDMSGAATISINALPVAQTVTGGGSYCADGTGVTIGLGSSQSGVSYQLYQGGTAIGGAVAGTGSAVSFGMQAAAGTYSVLATGTGACSRAMSGTATVSITPNVIPEVTMALSTGTTVCAGTAVTYTATGINGGSTPAYEWSVNGLTSGTGTSLAYSPADGDVVSVQLTGSAACAVPAMVSTFVTMEVSPAVTPVVNITADHSGAICRGTTVTYMATGENGGATPAYSWLRNGILQTTGVTYTVAPNDGDEVVCVLNSSAACATVATVTSNALVAAVVDPLNPGITITADATVIHEGEPVTFTAILEDAGVAPEVQWLINGAEVSGATTLSFVSSLLADLDTVSCRLTVSSPCGTKELSASVVVNMAGVGVGEVDGPQMDVRIMPNPNSGTFTVRGAVGAATVQAEVTNMLGQVVYRGEVRTKGGVMDHSISLDNSLVNGMYLLRLTAGNNTQVFHVTVEK